MLVTRRSTAHISSSLSILKSLSPERKACVPFLRSRARTRANAHVIMDEINGENPKSHHGHDTHAIPPQAICNAYKKYQKMEDTAIDDDLDILDFNRGLSGVQREKLVVVGEVSAEVIEGAVKKFGGFGGFGGFGKDVDVEDEDVGEVGEVPRPCTIYEHKDFPGLRLYPSLLPPECQVMLLDRLMHRDLANPLHKTNFHDQYIIPYPEPGKSLFYLPPSSKTSIFYPKTQSQPQSTSNSTATTTTTSTDTDTNTNTNTSTASHPTPTLKPLQTSQALHKKLRWLTLGTQYDWQTRLYPTNPTTPFPPDIRDLVTSLFPNFTPESGVVLLYSPKDYMPVHRDVSEQSSHSLASFSLGCDGLFVIAREMDGYVCREGEVEDEEREMRIFIVRVRSGDVVQLGGESRWVWHAMPKVVNGTLPKWLEEWPASPVGKGKGKGKKKGGPREFEKWSGYMRGKRLNISCRQVFDHVDGDGDGDGVRYGDKNRV